MMFLNCFQLVTTFEIVSCDSYLARRTSATSCNETKYYIFYNFIPHVASSIRSEICITDEL